MEKIIRWLVERYLPNHHIKLKPKRASKPRAPRVKKEIKEKGHEQEAQV